MTKNYKMYCKSRTTLFVLLIGLLFIPASLALATAVDRMSICDIECYPGDIINMEITLEGTDAKERSGFWYTYYKDIESDDHKMDITSWIEIEPKDYIIKEEETKIFNVKIKIPEDAEPGLWGAVSEYAGREGHSTERRSYIVFKDAFTDGNIYSGFLIPTSVNVLPSPDPLIPIINFVKKNIVTIVLSIVIVILLVRPLLRRKSKLPEELQKQ